MSSEKADDVRIHTPTRRVPEQIGDFWSRTGNSAITWTNGVHIGPATGIDLSAHTGYTTEAHLRIDFHAVRRLAVAKTPARTPIC